MSFRAHKVVSVLPATLQADAIYCVRTGTGFDLFVTDATGQIAHQINSPTAVSFPTDAAAEAYSTANPTAIVFSTEGL